MNIGDLIDQYEQGARLRGLAPTQMNALKPVRRGLGRRTPGNLTPGTISRYVGERRRGVWSEVHGCREAANGTIRRELGALSAVLNWAHQKRVLKDAPPSIDLPPMSPPRENFLTLTEADWLFAHGAGVWRHSQDKVGLFTCLALDTWARANAIETLEWSRVSFDRNTIDYRDPVKHVTTKRRVAVPMSRRLANVLVSAKPTDPRDLCHLVTGPVTQYQWRKFLEITPFTGLTRHDLRRTGISLAVARGVDLMKIAQAAGDDYTTILKHYARFSPSYLEGVME